MNDLDESDKILMALATLLFMTWCAAQ